MSMVRIAQEERSTVHIPATLIALMSVMVLGGMTIGLANWAGLPILPILLFPIWAALGGFVATRWALYPPQIPGFTIGLIGVAVQVGLALGIGGFMLRLVAPRLLIVEVLSALCGGLVGSVLVRRIRQLSQPPEPERSVLS